MIQILPTLFFYHISEISQKLQGQFQLQDRFQWKFHKLLVMVRRLFLLSIYDNEYSIIHCLLLFLRHVFFCREEGNHRKCIYINCETFRMGWLIMCFVFVVSVDQPSVWIKKNLNFKKFAIVNALGQKAQIALSAWIRNMN